MAHELVKIASRILFVKDRYFVILASLGKMKKW